MQDYYGLYGIFDSSRYAFPGSEQKQKVRCLMPLYRPRRRLHNGARSIPKSASCVNCSRAIGSLYPLRSCVRCRIWMAILNCKHRSRRQQRCASTTWAYSGPVAVTNAAKVLSLISTRQARMVSAYRAILATPITIKVEQAIHPKRDARNSPQLYFNLDFEWRILSRSLRAGISLCWGKILTSRRWC